MTQLSYTVAQAAAITGISEYMIRAAIRSGDLETYSPEINGRRIRKQLIWHGDLESWVKGST